MAKCDVPDCPGDDSLAFTCNECGGDYCANHRLPEKHLCEELQSTKRNRKEVFSTGLQDKDDKKRGFTERTDSRRAEPSHRSRTEGAGSLNSDDLPAHVTERSRDDTSDNDANSEPQTNSLRQILLAVGSHSSSIRRRMSRSTWNPFGASARARRARVRNLLRIVGITLVLIGGVRLFASYPLDNPVLSRFRRANDALQVFPTLGWITYIVGGLVLYRVADIKTGRRSVSAQVTNLLKVVGIVLILSIVVIGFTPATLPDETPGVIREPIQDTADISAGVVGNLTDESGVEQSPGDAPTPTTEGRSTGSPSDAPSSAGLDRERIERLVHEKINERRENRSLGRLNFDTGLREIARYHSSDMAERDYFAHTGPNGETMGDRYDRFGYDCRVSTSGNQYATGGENIYRTQYSGLGYTNEEIAEQTVMGWMNSPGHRENLLQDYWENEGIGVEIASSDGSTEILVTQNFC